MIKELISGGIGKLVGGVKDLVSEFHLAPEKELEFQAKLREMEKEETLAITKAAESVLVSESKSDDPWVRRARPTFLWLMYGIFLYNWIVRPAMGDAPLVLQEEIVWLFGAGFLGYTGARSWDKNAPTR
jgi:hypothetical protein